MKEKAQKFMKKGIEIVKMNEAAIDAGASAYVKIDVPASWAAAVCSLVQMQMLLHSTKSSVSSLVS